MAPRLSKIERVGLKNVIISKLQGEEVIKDEDIANKFGPCTTRTVRKARSNIPKYGTIGTPSQNTGRPREVAENMWLALQNQLIQEPCMSQQDMANFLHQEYGVRVSRSTISRTLMRVGWTKKAEQMICVDESGSDRGLATLGRGYAPKGATPVQRERFHRGKRVQVLPAYTIDGVIYCEAYEENTDTQVFEGFLERLLPFCGRYPEPRSVIFMDNASFHFFSPKTKEILAAAGVIIEYQPPYSCDLTPIEFLFGSTKNRIRRRAREDDDLIRGDFKSYLLMQIRVVGSDKNIARGHLRKAQIENEEDMTK
ncbi:hypothetical protein S40288_09383 [Stachybotrys chartarum IBT 40288]|nr:hypothetical protein S40288_09383 [Stachybotrys chartarum IBT 40288]